MNGTGDSHAMRYEGFSFVEVLLAVTVVSLALLTYMALIPIGLESSRDAVNNAIIGHILEDAHERLEGQKLQDGIPQSSPLYYDDQGVYFKPDPRDADPIRLQRRLYRVDVRLVSPFDEDLKERAPGLKAVILTVGWPVNDQGEVIGPASRKNRKSITYYVNTMTGPEWTNIDEEFEPVIGY